jgi:hypothetical protein
MAFCRVAGQHDAMSIAGNVPKVTPPAAVQDALGRGRNSSVSWLILVGKLPQPRS